MDYENIMWFVKTGSISLIGLLGFAGIIWLSKWYEKNHYIKLTEDDMDFMDDVHGVTPELKSYFFSLARRRFNNIRRRTIGSP